MWSAATRRRRQFGFGSSAPFEERRVKTRDERGDKFSLLAWTKKEPGAVALEV